MVRMRVVLFRGFFWTFSSLLLTAQVHAEDQQNADTQAPAQLAGYAGSASCRECHEKFYQLWSTSFHGLAMQPYTDEFAAKQLSPQKEDIVVGNKHYLAEIGPGQGWVVEKGEMEPRNYKIEQVLGGKNVYYFLAMLEKGRLQTLPLAYDVQKKQWLDTAQSGMRHIRGEQPVHWTDPAYTFNTSCYGCHVSQLATNYDAKSDSYHTTWNEPGINCETCHGPAQEHNKVARAAPKDQALTDIRIISTKTMTTEERNSLCVSCHAKAVPLTTSFAPRDRFFDHFDLVTLENPDYYPDGRDLGENYTYTSWRMSPCAKSGKLDCMHCHTSSGRYRFKEDANANDACLPCHQQRVEHAAVHTHHKPGKAGNKCISCHMPMTEFARMNRSDHSMLPPTPATTMRFNSPNACTSCHDKKGAAWADKFVRKWRTRNYQAPVLARAKLLDAARKGDWSTLSAMLDYLQSKDRDEIFAASLIRLLPQARDQRVQPVLLGAAKDDSPLIRAAAVEALGEMPRAESLQALVEATGDDFRLVRIKAAAALSHFPQLNAQGAYGEQLKKAKEEYLAFIMARPDQWTSYYNMGNYYLDRKENDKAVDSFRSALKLEPQAVMGMVNLSIAQARKGENNEAEDSLKQALALSPENAAANFNMGLLKAEQNDIKQAELYLRKALSADPRMAEAAYNLCVILAGDRLNEALSLCRKASELRLDDPKYAYTLAFYEQQKGDTGEAINTLEKLIGRQPSYLDAYLLLAGIYEEQDRKNDAQAVYARALALEGIPEAFKEHVEAKLKALKP
jgi:tetratricopeptide (TPR) repeat protein